MKRLVVCGDSFNAGIGCRDLTTQPYAVRLAKALEMEPIILARGSASNYSVHLQAKYALRLNPEIVIIAITSYDRIEWLAENKKNGPTDITAEQINYHQYPPHQGYFDGKKYPYFFQNQKIYNPRLLTEQIGALDDCLSIRDDASLGDPTYYARLSTEPRSKLELIRDYYLNIFEYGIKRNYDLGVIFMAYSIIKKAGIRCVVISSDPEAANLMGDDVVNINWYEMCKSHPDTIGSGHTSEEGHEVVTRLLLEKINGNLIR